MGFGSFLEKIGSMFMPGKAKISNEDKIKVKSSVETILNYGELTSSGGGVMAIVINRDRSAESDKLEKMVGVKDTNPEKAQLLDFILKMIASKSDQPLRNTFLDLADFEWTENSVRHSVSTWPSVINDFMSLGQLMPGETNTVIISKKLNISKEEAEFLSVKQAVYKRWKDELRDKTKKNLGGMKK